MDIDSKIFVLLIIAISTIGWIFNNWIRAKHGYQLEDEWGGKTPKTEHADTSRLETENRKLHEKIDAMQDRMIVLEKIVTDRGYSLSAEIEALRDTAKLQSTGSSVPLNLANKETA